jgi:hypothetical protein
MASMPRQARHGRTSLNAGDDYQKRVSDEPTRAREHKQARLVSSHKKNPSRQTHIHTFALMYELCGCCGDTSMIHCVCACCLCACVSVVCTPCQTHTHPHTHTHICKHDSGYANLCLLPGSLLTSTSTHAGMFSTRFIHVIALLHARYAAASSRLQSMTCL